jgi:SAM-dependent methyltransferase
MKKILDVTCGGRMMWFNKNHECAVYVDRRRVEKGTIEQQPNFCVEPDIVADFTDLPFDDNTFSLVVFDPPHIKIAARGIMTTKYGWLDEDWKDVILAGFNECIRVLKEDGVLIFKWNEASISVSEITKLFPQKPLFGHTTAKSGKTKWMTFMKGC